MLLPTWVAGVDSHAIMLAVFGTIGAQVLNNIIAAEISGKDYTANPDKIRAGVVASVVATLLIVMLLIIIYRLREHVGIDAALIEPAGYTITI